MDIIIPEKYRQEFDKAAEFAIEKQVFTPTELAEHLEKGVLVASIMVGYMEKTGLVTKGKSDDARRARITMTQWEALDKCIENYVPLPEPEPDAFVQHTQDFTVTDISDIITKEIHFVNKTVTTENGFLIIHDDETKTALSLDDISVIYLHKGGILSKSTLTFSCDLQTPVKAHLRADTVCFRRRDYDKVKSLALAIAKRLGIQVKE